MVDPGNMKILTGLVIRSISGFFTVSTPEGDFICRVRGRLKKGHLDGDIVAVGDRVKIMTQVDGTGSIEEVAPRVHALVRLAPTPRGIYQQVLLANADQVVFIFACANPEPHLRMLDRFLVIAEKQGIPPVIVANKVDLIGKEQAMALFEHYRPIGYTIIYTSAKTGEGISTLRDCLIGKLSAFSGPSGVGKSSLLNTIQPDLGLAVREVSQATSKGRHTTVVRELFPIKEGGYVADTPGIRQLAL